MKHTIEGFSQGFAITLKKSVELNGKTIIRKIDCTDLVILRWFVDFYPNMKKVEVDGKRYAWVTHKKLIDDLPLIDISKKAFIERMQKLVEFDILEYKFVKDGGTFSLYGFGKNYEHLIGGVAVQTGTGCTVEPPRGSRSNGYGVAVQTDTKDSSIKDNSVKDIITYLNSVISASYKYQSAITQKHIKARLNEGYTVEDFKTVIDKKVAEWKGTEMAQYLRPETLFGSKFESYLNAPQTTVKTTVKTATTHFENERQYTKAEMDALITNIDDIDF